MYNAHYIQKVGECFLDQVPFYDLLDSLDQMPLSNCRRTSRHAERNSRCSQILATANTQIACVHMNKPRDMNGNGKTCREYTR